MAWWSLNDIFCAQWAYWVQKTTLVEYIFIPRHMIFPGGLVTPGSRRPNVWSIDCECKTKNWYIALQIYFKHLKNRNFFRAISLFLADFSWKFVTWFLAGSSCFSWHDLAGLSDNHLATLHSANVRRTAMRAVYPCVHTLIKVMLTISCTAGSVERYLSTKAVLYIYEITAGKNDWVAISQIILHRNVKVNHSKST